MKKRIRGKISILARFLHDPSQMNEGRLMKIWKMLRFLLDTKYEKAGHYVVTLKSTGLENEQVTLKMELIVENN